jgi:hypothetical protein
MDRSVASDGKNNLDKYAKEICKWYQDKINSAYRLMNSPRLKAICAAE